MSASLLVFVPVALFFVVGSLCFVGCILNSTGDGFDKPYSQYSGVDVLKNPSIVAYWPLSEPSGTEGNPVETALAVDAAGTKIGVPHNGNYTHKGNAPDLFPCPRPSPPVAPGVDSAEAVGFLALGMPGIVKGDALQPLNDPNVLTTAMQIDGGFVRVPVDKVINPDPPFSIEAWVRPEWDSTDDLPAFRVFIDAHDNSGTEFSGFALSVNQDGNWQATLGTGGTNFVSAVAGLADLTDRSHVVLTFDGTDAVLYINGAPKTTTAVPDGQKFVPNTTVPFIIGAGLPWLPDRTPQSDPITFPLLPFKGKIQDVAIYADALTDELIKSHFDNGSGKAPSAG